MISIYISMHYVTELKLTRVELVPILRCYYLRRYFCQLQQHCRYQSR